MLQLFLIKIYFNFLILKYFLNLQNIKSFKFQCYLKLKIYLYKCHQGYSVIHQLKNNINNI